MGFDANNPFSLPASGDLSASQYCGVTLNASGQLALPAAGGSVIGVLYTKPNAITRPGTVYGPGSGIRKVRYGAAVTLAAPALKVNAAGQFIPASAADISAGSCVAIAVMAGGSGEVGAAIIFGTAQQVPAGSFDDIVLGTTAPSNLTPITFVQVTGTKTGVLANGVTPGQTKRFIQSVAASTPVGTITGAFAQNSGTAAATLSLGTTVGTIADFVWTGSVWRLTSALGGTGSTLV